MDIHTLVHSSIQATIWSLCSQFHSLLINSVTSWKSSHTGSKRRKKKGGGKKEENKQSGRFFFFFLTPSRRRQKLISTRRCVAAHRQAATCVCCGGCQLAQAQQEVRTAGTGLDRPIRCWPASSRCRSRLSVLGCTITPGRTHTIWGATPPEDKTKKKTNFLLCYLLIGTRSNRYSQRRKGKRFPATAGKTLSRP